MDTFNNADFRDFLHKKGPEPELDTSLPVCGGRNGISFCTVVRAADQGPYIVMHPITTIGEMANTFIDVPADAETLTALAGCFEALARARTPEQDSHEEWLKRRYRCAAEDIGFDGEGPLHVDDDALVSIEGRHGAHVLVWVWVASDDLECETTSNGKLVNAPGNAS